MANKITLDFTDAPPVQGGGRTDYIPPAQYMLQIDKAEKVKTKDGSKDMIVVSLSVAGGDYKGKRLIDRFTLPRAGSEDSKLGLQRFHSILLAVSGKDLTGKKTELNLDSLVGKKMLSEIADDEQPASEDGKYKARTTSKPVAYYKPEAPGTAKPLPAAEPDPEPVQAEMDDQGGTTDETDIADSLEDLFADD